ncbi:sodium/glutamate symporter family protein [Kocuria marina]|uniref:hypothetical protein n=1 Tax=Kocuria marina TaxID=223184 RepID=UPI0021B5E106|nr:MULTISPECIES: hypothetical protein [Kocuria]MCT2020968.1 hypothetical protein [Kocuria marina]
MLGRFDGPWGENGLFAEGMVETWGVLPGLLISVIFATMFLGQDLPSPKRAAKLVGPQLSLGVAFGSGQYVIGLLLAVLILVPVFPAAPMTGAHRDRFRGWPRHGHRHVTRHGGPGIR